MRKRCRLFKENRANVHDEERNGRLSLVTDDLKAKVNAKIRENRELTIYELYEHFPDVFRFLAHEVVSEYLHYKKLCVI